MRHEQSILEKIYAQPSSISRKQLQRTFRNFRAPSIGAVPPPSFQQRSMAKLSYTKGSPRALMKHHARYLERHATPEQKEKGIGFNRDTDNVSVSRQVENWRIQNNEVAFKIVLSPEKASKLSMKEHVRGVMAHIEKVIQRPTQWVAVIHNDTAHPHAHIIMRGRDTNGQRFRLPKDLIRKGVREKSQELATQKLGYRTLKEIKQELRRNVTAKRITPFDRKLDRLTTQEGFIDKKKLTIHKKGKENFLEDRLKFLEKMGLATQNWKGWTVQSNLIPKLREVSISQDIVKQRAQGIRR